MRYIPESEINDINNKNIDIKEDKKENITKLNIYVKYVQIYFLLIIIIHWDVDIHSVMIVGLIFYLLKLKKIKYLLLNVYIMNAENKLSDDFIIKLLNLKELNEKYKFELKIVNNPNKKFYPNPDCNSYLELKNEKDKNKNVKYLNVHIFCFIYLKEPHKNSQCENNLDNSLIYFSNNHFIKKCPNCSIVTEKNEGCNHITCSKSNYQVMQWKI